MLTPKRYSYRPKQFHFPRHMDCDPLPEIGLMGLDSGILRFEIWAKSNRFQQAIFLTNLIIISLDIFIEWPKKLTAIYQPDELSRFSRKIINIEKISHLVMKERIQGTLYFPMRIMRIMRSIVKHYIFLPI